MNTPVADAPESVADEFALLARLLPPDGARVLDLDCGKCLMRPMRMNRRRRAG